MARERRRLDRAADSYRPLASRCADCSLRRLRARRRVTSQRPRRRRRRRRDSRSRPRLCDLRRSVDCRAPRAATTASLAGERRAPVTSETFLRWLFAIERPPAIDDWAELERWLDVLQVSPLAYATARK